MSKTEVFRPSGINKAFGASGSSLHEFVGTRNKAAFSAGAVYMRDVDFDWDLWYDEFLICIDPGEHLEIAVDGAVHVLARGDSIWLEAGTRLTYRSKGTAMLYFAVTPVDWQQKRPAS